MQRTFWLTIWLTLFLLSSCRQQEPTQTIIPPGETAVPVIDTPASETVVTSRLEERPCETYNPAIGEKEGQTYTCGVMTVPQDRAQPEGEQVEIKYAILKSLSASPLSDPMVLLSGGPGNSALYPDAFAEMAERFRPLRQERDIILFDQRGVGASTPQLDCALVSPPDESHYADLLARYTAVTDLELNDENRYPVECVLGLWDQGIELSNFTSAAAAADTVDLLYALQKEYGYTAFNLYAISYGTWLGETIARDFPEEPLIRTLIQDSVFPRPKSEYIADFYIEKYGMLEHLFEACEADVACNEAYPDLATRFRSLVDALNASPLTLPNDRMLNGEQLIQSIYPFVDRGANWVEVIPYLPKMIADLEQGNTDSYLGVQSGSLPPLADDEYAPPDVVYDMLEITHCSAVADQQQRNDLYRQMYNVPIEASKEIINELCTPDEAAPLLAMLESMTPRDVNELVKRIYLSPVRGTSPTMRTHFNCTETFPFGEDQATMSANMKGANMPEFLTIEATDRIPQATANCSVWPAMAVSPTENEPVSSLYAALFISGEWDYVTFPRWADEAHNRWPNSFYLYVPDGMHSVLGNFGECPTDVTLQFLADPTTELEMSCTETMKTKWVLPP